MERSRSGFTFGPSEVDDGGAVSSQFERGRVNWDIDLLRAINGLAGRSPLIDAFMLGLGHASNLVLPLLLVFAYWLWTDRREARIGSISLAALVVVTDFLGAQVKHVAARPRPCRLIEGIHQLGGCGGTFGFPSNHAMNTAAAAAFAQVLYPATGWVTWPLVVLIGVSRVYVGSHFATDVLGGWMMGIVLGAGGGWLVSRRRLFRGDAEVIPIRKDAGPSIDSDRSAPPRRDSTASPSESSDV